jgi:hypothetical protein
MRIMLSSKARAARPFLHDRHFSAASSFQIGASRGRRMVSSGMLARVSLRLGCDALLRHDRDDPACWVARLNFHHRTDHPRDRQSLQHHRRLLAPVLSVAAASSLYWISNFDSLHASPMVAVCETVPRRSARYQRTVKQKFPM